MFSAHSNCWADQTELIENTIDEAKSFHTFAVVSPNKHKGRRVSSPKTFITIVLNLDIVSIPSDATPAEDKPTAGDDPQDDPDYDSAGWGTDSASVSYTQLIPLLIKSNQSCTNESLL